LAKNTPIVARFLLKSGTGIIKKYSRQKNCRFAKLYEKTAITLPLYPLLKEVDIRFISDKIKSFYKK